MSFTLTSEFKPTGDQPQAVEKLSKGVVQGSKQTLLGVTGSGKTFTIANVIAKTGKNALIISHNKTLAAQLYSEFKEFFAKNNVEYFVSYYDYYQPESYMPAKDMYIEKTAMVNEKIEQMRFSATASLLSREPTVIIASVSCIYGLGSPKDYDEMALHLEPGLTFERSELLKALTAIQYERNDAAPGSGDVRSRGNIVDVFPSYRKLFYRIELDGTKIKSIASFDSTTQKFVSKLDSVRVFPARHFVVPQERVKPVVAKIRSELVEQLPKLGEMEAHRLKTRVNYDCEMIENTGFCKGIENYSRYFDGRAKGEKPFCLLDFIGDDSILVVDESHVTIPQLHGMYNGDFTRKKTLVEYGFRLPSALDNRPLKYEEFEEYVKRRPTIFVSATPGEYERRESSQVVEQLVRPTGIVDPVVVCKPTLNSIPDLCSEIQSTTKAGWRTLVTTLTKRQAEDLTEFLLSKGVKARYLHSEIETLERTDLVRRLRLGEFDCLVGINLLREGLDIPEVGLVAILDADKEGFLRNETSLIQTIGRAARNSNSRAILYFDRETPSIRNALRETDRRRAYQIAFNKRHGITPSTIVKKVTSIEGVDESPSASRRKPTRKALIDVEMEMKRAAESLDFERAIKLRDEIRLMRESLARGKKDA